MRGTTNVKKILDHPYTGFAFSLVVLWVSIQIGTFAGQKLRPLPDDEREDFGNVINATLTLLALIIGFSFSMAVSRYDQRKNYEEAEANAIGRSPGTPIHSTDQGERQGISLAAAFNFENPI
jgi:hypothetical protein